MCLEIIWAVLLAFKKINWIFNYLLSNKRPGFWLMRRPCNTYEYNSAAFKGKNIYTVIDMTVDGQEVTNTGFVLQRSWCKELAN